MVGITRSKVIFCVHGRGRWPWPVAVAGGRPVMGGVRGWWPVAVAVAGG